MRNKILILSLVGVLAGCGGGSDNAADETTQAAKEKLVALEASGAIPKLDRSNTLAGTDANSNGIRDDVETLIAHNYTSSAQRTAAMQTAKALQSALTVDASDVSAVKMVDRKISRGINCIYSKFDASHDQNPAQVAKELEAITTNTKQRLLTYLRFNKALDGTSSALPEGDSCD